MRCSRCSVASGEAEAEQGQLDSFGDCFMTKEQILAEKMKLKRALAEDEMKIDFDKRKNARIGLPKETELTQGLNFFGPALGELKMEDILPEHRFMIPFMEGFRRERGNKITEIKDFIQQRDPVFEAEVLKEREKIQLRYAQTNSPDALFQMQRGEWRGRSGAGTVRFVWRLLHDQRTDSS
eukprot:TRINITY_DN3085_c0_g1_i1.p3 TRINITY_DN3085_c0_g1~~TRINITY_DN3085_c0_g1_i1.p3  ORF type:complete len:181 (+),score=31.76 TRINITY_DN3085_c0_g1_i1:245-787(+)